MSKIARNRKNSMYPRACTLRLLLINIDYRLGHQVTERPYTNIESLDIATEIESQNSAVRTHDAVG